MQKVTAYFDIDFFNVEAKCLLSIIKNDEGLFYSVNHKKMVQIIGGNLSAAPMQNISCYNNNRAIINKIFEWVKSVKKYQKNEILTAEWSLSGDLHITIGTAVARFAFSAIEWRPLGEKTEEKTAIPLLCTLPATLLKEVKKQKFYSNDAAETAFLNPVVDTLKSRLVCTDGKCLAIWPLPIFDASAECARFIPVEIRDWRSGDLGVFEKSKNEIEFKFPNYEDYIPAAVGKAIINLKEAEAALKRILPALNKETPKIVMKITKNKIVFSGKNESGGVITEIPADATHEFEAAYDAKNLIKAFNGGCDEFYFSGSKKPALLKSEKMLLITMPMMGDNNTEIDGATAFDFNAWEAIARLAHPAQTKEKTPDKNGGSTMETKKQENPAEVAENVTIAQKTKKPAGQIIVCTVPPCPPAEKPKIIEVITENAGGVKNCDFVEVENLESYLAKKAEKGFYPASEKKEEGLANFEKFKIMAIAMELMEEEAEEFAQSELDKILREEATAEAVDMAIAQMEENPDLVPDSLVDALTAPEHADPHTCEALNRLAHPTPLEFVKEEFAPHFVVKIFTNRERTKIYAPEIFPIAYADEEAVICQSADGKEYRYNRDNFGKIRLAKKGRGSASINLLTACRPTMEEIAKMSAQLLEALR